MAISFNTGTTAANSGVTSLNITIPAGVLSGDVVFVLAQVFQNTALTVGESTTGTALTQISTTQVSGPSGGFDTNGALWYFVASGTDAGKVVTVTSTTSAWISIALAAYTGASGSAPIDVSGGNTDGINGSSVSSWACPSLTTGVSGDWGIYFCCAFSSGAITVPGGTTQREQSNTANVCSAIADSNGSVGGAGTGIGGLSFTTGNSHTNWTAFTVGLAPPGGAAAATPAPLVVPQAAVMQAANW